MKIILEIRDLKNIIKYEFINGDDLINVAIDTHCETVYITTTRSDHRFSFIDLYSAECFFKSMTEHRFLDDVIIKLGINENERYIIL